MKMESSGGEKEQCGHIDQSFGFMRLIVWAKHMRCRRDRILIMTLNIEMIGGSKAILLHP